MHPALGVYSHPLFGSGSHLSLLRGRSCKAAANCLLGKVSHSQAVPCWLTQEPAPAQTQSCFPNAAGGEGITGWSPGDAWGLLQDPHGVKPKRDAHLGGCGDAKPGSSYSPYPPLWYPNAAWSPQRKGGDTLQHPCAGGDGEDTTHAPVSSKPIKAPIPAHFRACL